MSNENYIKQMELHLEDVPSVQKVMHALSTDLRLRILLMTGNKTMSICELAEALDMPISTIAVNISVLEKAGLLITEQVPGVRGLQRRCTKVTDYVAVNLKSRHSEGEKIGELSMPVGGYSLCGEIEPTCGLADAEGFIGVPDEPLNFYLPSRFGAQLLWFRRGFVEYHFPILPLRNPKLEKIEIIVEACSEAIGYDNTCVSDIFFQVNGTELGIWRSPGDFGGRKGLLNPDWWQSFSTQFGMLKVWRITHNGTYLDDVLVSPVTLKCLDLMQREYFSLRIGIHGDAKHIGGINLFGRSFGDVPQDILLRYYIS